MKVDYIRTLQNIAYAGVKFCKLKARKFIALLAIEKSSGLLCQIETFIQDNDLECFIEYI